MAVMWLLLRLLQLFVAAVRLRVTIREGEGDIAVVAVLLLQVIGVVVIIAATDVVSEAMRSLLGLSSGQKHGKVLCYLH